MSEANDRSCTSNAVSLSSDRRDARTIHLTQQPKENIIPPTAAARSRRGHRRRPPALAAVDQSKRISQKGTRGGGQVQRSRRIRCGRASCTKRGTRPNYSLNARARARPKPRSQHDGHEGARSFSLCASRAGARGRPGFASPRSGKRREGLTAPRWPRSWPCRGTYGGFRARLCRRRRTVPRSRRSRIALILGNSVA